MRTYFWRVAALVLSGIAASPVFAQKPYSGSWRGGGAVRPDGSPAYSARNSAWSFEAEIRYKEHGYVRAIEHLIVLPDRAMQKTWADYRPVPQPISKKAPPAFVYFYDAKRGNILFEARPLDYGKTFRPTHISCLMALQQKLASVGPDALRKRYDLPASFPVADIDGLRAERYIGAKTGSKGRGFGPNFTINGLPSGYGWPLLMFRLTVCTPDALQAAGIRPRFIGKEKVAGMMCDKYAAGDTRMPVTLWIEPKTKIALKEETLVTPPRPFPGSRMPPRKPFIVGYEVTRFRRIKDAPRHLFAPPPGTTVELPELLRDLPLPSGVKRQPIRGMEAKLGIPLNPYTLGAGVVSTSR